MPDEELSTSTRWLSAEDQQSWRAFIDLNQILADRLEQQLQRDSSMHYAYYEILVRLSEREGRSMRMGDLATATRTSPSRISHAVARLEDRGWLTRVPYPGDGRGQMAMLTDAGFKALEDAAPGHVEEVRRSILDALTPKEISELGRISKKALDWAQAPAPE